MIPPFLAVADDRKLWWYRDIPISLTTTTTIMPSKSIDKNNINEYIIWLYEHLTGIIPISFICVLFLCKTITYIYIPYRYYQPLVQSGVMEKFIQTILNVNNDTSDHKHRRIVGEINLPVSTTSSKLSTPPAPTYTERTIIDEYF
ncbi:unnamed protein product [Rotaria magnacalcarata]|uniref:Uncharacterized protein n=1 Tax=Rotaria magnacalcarata TaxID=392030 RepID=A0A817AQ59_9BILA|nr:unnamed protein product [Rotaria magnacalcarata]CAF3830851.1 unnamed protein product [Rotaria magnacalcarata]